jgi:hypothetical protein
MKRGYLRNLALPLLAAALVLAGFLLTPGCSGGGSTGSGEIPPSPTPSPTATISPTPTPTLPPLSITSPNFEEGGLIPLKNAHDSVGGSNYSIPLQWQNPPAGTQTYYLTVIDADNGDFLNWCIFNVPAGVTALEENASAAGIPPGSIQIDNSSGQPGYYGPAPPLGSTHKIVITIYALSSSLSGVDENSTLGQVQAAAQGKVLATAVLNGYYTCGG